MFKIDTYPEFTRPVIVHTPEGETTRTDTFQATFRALPDDDLAEHNTLSLDGQKELLRAVVVSLGDIVGFDEKPVEFTPDLLETAMGNSFARNALLEAFSTAYAEAQLGNSAGRVGRGQTAR